MFWLIGVPKMPSTLMTAGPVRNALTAGMLRVMRRRTTTMRYGAQACTSGIRFLRCEASAAGLTVPIQRSGQR